MQNLRTVAADSASQCAPEAWPQPSAAMWHAAGASMQANMHANHVASEPCIAAPHDGQGMRGGSAMALDEVASWAGHGANGVHGDGCNGCAAGVGARSGKGKGGAWGPRGSGDVCMRDNDSAPGRASATAVMHALKVRVMQQAGTASPHHHLGSTTAKCLMAPARMATWHQHRGPPRPRSSRWRLPRRDAALR